MEWNIQVQYKKSKEPPKCTGLFILNKWTESLFDLWNVLSTSITTPHNYIFLPQKYFLVSFYQDLWIQNMKPRTLDDFLFCKNFISRLLSHKCLKFWCLPPIIRGVLVGVDTKILNFDGLRAEICSFQQIRSHLRCSISYLALKALVKNAQMRAVETEYKCRA